MLILNGLNEWNEERYELTGYINDINTANTQVLMEFHDKGYAGNIYEYGVKRESVTHWSNTNYYGYDGRGSVSDIIDCNGEVQMYHSYEPDGQTTMRFRSYVKNPYRYNAERVDYIPGIADFQYLRARYYTPDTARFIQQDTVWGKIDVPLSQNLYAYCGNNPLNFVDPSGRYPKEAEEYYKTKIENEVKRMQGILNNNSLGLSERQAIQDQISYLRSTENPDNKTLSVMTGTTVGISIKKATNGSERVDCDLGIWTYFEKFTFAETTVGGRKYSAHALNLSKEIQEYIAALANYQNVDYYLVLAFIAHESGSESIPNQDRGKDLTEAKGYMQITQDTWNSYVDVNYTNEKGKNVSYYNQYEEYFVYANDLGATSIKPAYIDYGVNDPRYHGLSNIAVGIAVLSEWYHDNSNEGDWKYAVGRYGEGPNSSATYEILYYRDYLAHMKGKDTWYVGTLYDEQGVRK